MADVGHRTGHYHAGLGHAAVTLGYSAEAVDTAEAILRRAGHLRIVGSTSKGSRVYRLEPAFSAACPTRTIGGTREVPPGSFLPQPDPGEGGGAPPPAEATSEPWTPIAAALAANQEWSHLVPKASTLYHRLVSLVGTAHALECFEAFVRTKVPGLPLEFTGSAEGYFVKALTGYAQDRGWKAAAPLTTAETMPDAVNAATDPTTLELLQWVQSPNAPERRAIAHVFTPTFAYGLAGYIDETDGRGRLLSERKAYFQALADIAFREAPMVASPMPEARLAREIMDRFQRIRRAALNETRRRQR